MRRHLPLTALRAFEAVARLKSISGAAAEINVTRPAVSKQVTLLEATLGLQLLARTGNAIRLTGAGEELFAGLCQGFDIISASLEAAASRTRQSRRLRVLVCRDFASSWLAGRVGRFLVENPGVSLEVIAEKNGSMRLDEDFDFRIFYGLAGSLAASGLTETELCRWIDLPVCTRAFAERHLQGPNPPCDAPCLIDANYDVWDEWCTHTGFQAGGPRTSTTIFNETTLCLSVATSGGGLTIGDSFLTLPAIMAGDLVVPFPAGLLSAQCYSLFTVAGRKPAQAARQFETWLKAAVASYQSSVLDELAKRNIRVVSRA
ncbi:MAG: LysR family transcriptional regulator [Hyphomicrobiales bacterium]